VIKASYRIASWLSGFVGFPFDLLHTHKYDIFTHRKGSVRTNIDIDDRLMSEAMRRSGARTKKAAVEAALRLLATTHAQSSLRRLKGKVHWEGDLNELRRAREKE
jgi:Arc/MetJ family transcription regulator